MVEMQMEEDTCAYDFVTMYDGGNTDDASTLKLCSLDGNTYTSASSSALIVFQSDVSNGEGGFSLRWNFVGQSGGRYTIVP